MSEKGKCCPGTTFKKGDKLQISFFFQGKKEISGTIKEAKVIANALVAVVEDDNNKYKTLSGTPLEYTLIKYRPGKILYFLVKDGAIRSVSFEIK